MLIILNSIDFVSQMSESGDLIKDAELTVDGKYAVNTIYSENTVSLSSPLFLLLLIWFVYILATPTSVAPK